MKGIGFLTISVLTGLLSWKLIPQSYGSLRWLCIFIFICVAGVFQLILCEVLQTGDSELRVQLWKFETVMLLFCIIVVAPIFQIYKLCTVRIPKLRKLTIFVVLGYLLLFYYAGQKLPIERIPQEGEDYNHYWYIFRQDCLATVSFIGITTMAFLCGLSSVSVPYTAFIGDKIPSSEVDIQRLEENIKNIDEMLKTKDLQTSRLRLDLSSSNSGANQRSGFIGRLAGMVSKSDDRHNQMKSLKSEQKALERLKQEVETDLYAVKAKHENVKYSRTFMGRVHALVYIIFACYCVYRVCNTYIRMGWWLWSKQVNPSGGPKDALVMIAATAINRVIPDILDIDGWSRVIGVFTSGIVFAASMNGVLRTLYRIMRSFDKLPFAVRLDPLVIAEIAGVYVLSIATSLRFNLPNNLSGPIMAAIASPLKMTSVQLWNDLVLSSASTLTLVILFLISNINDDQIYDEEKTSSKFI